MFVIRLLWFFCSQQAGAGNHIAMAPVLNGKGRYSSEKMCTGTTGCSLNIVFFPRILES